jgi:cell wall assembly regulator SMI1
VIDTGSPWDAVLDLLDRVTRVPGEVIRGASFDDLRRLEAALGSEVPESLAAWLSLCNGVTAGPGGLFGTGTSREFLNIECITPLFPSWSERGWIPVAGDGAGSYYVLETGGGQGTSETVLFIEATEDSETPSYLAASRLSRFLVFLLEKELDRNSGWPFRRKFFEERDPELLTIANTPLIPRT